MSEYVEFINKYPNIDFVGNSPSKDKSLFLLEAPNIAPQNYIQDHIKLYKRVYTYNSKLYKEYKELGIDVIKVPNFPLFDNYYNLDEFIPFEERIDGITLICRYRNEQNVDFDISHKRVEVFNIIEGMTKHCYGKISYCGEYYKGVIGEGKGTYPSSREKLEVMNKYKFNLCLENAYHQLWSWDYITEKIIDCFKAKVIPIYLGAYNIERRISEDLFIDFRKYLDGDEIKQENIDRLVEDLKKIDKEQFEDMTERAYEWQKNTKLGDVEELKRILDND